MVSARTGQVLFTHEVVGYVAYARLYGSESATIALIPGERLSLDLNRSDVFMNESGQIVVLTPEQCERVQRLEGRSTDVDV